MDLCKSMIISRKLIVPGYDIPHKAQICRSPNRQQNKIHNNDQNSNENHDRDGERKRLGPRIFNGKRENQNLVPSCAFE